MYLSPSLRSGRCALVLVILSVALLGAEPATAQGVFIRGDCDPDGELNIADAIHALAYLFTFGPEPECRAACDVNADGSIDISDPIGLLGYLFLGTRPPRPPFPDEDVDPFPDGETCLNGRLPVVELGVAPRRLRFFVLDEPRPLRVTGTRSDGSLVDLSTDPTLAVEVDPPGLAVVDALAVTATSVGRGRITLRYRRLESSVDVEVARGADGSPKVVVVFPEDGAYVTAPSLRITTWTDARGGRVEIAGGAASAETAGLFSRIVPLSPGENAVDVTVSNEVGATSTSVRVFRVDPSDPDHAGPDGLPIPAPPAPFTSAPDVEPPRVAILEPVDGAHLSSARVAVRGSVSDDGDGSTAVRVNGVPAIVTGETFEAIVRLSPGETSIEVVASDGVGNSSSERIDLTIGSGAPALDFEAPEIAAHTAAEIPGGFAWATTTPISVRGRANVLLARARVNRVDANIVGERFEADVELLPGLQRVAVVAEDTAGARVVASRRVFLDLHDPRIELFGGDTVTAHAGTVLLAGRVLDDSTALAGRRSLTLLVDGQPILLSSERFALRLPAGGVGASIELVARDGAGRESRRVVSVRRPSVLSLSASGGADQSVRAQTAAKDALEVVARRANGSPAVAVPVAFEILSGDGGLGAERERRVTAVSDGAGRAAVSFVAGREAGLAIVSASRSSASSGTGATETVVFGVHVQPDAFPPRLVARWGRWERGRAGETSSRPLCVRALDVFGNPVEGVAVAFDAVSGSPLFDGRSSTSRTTDADGIAFVSFLHPAVEGLETVTAHAGASARVTFTLESLAGGVSGDTRITGVVTNTLGIPVAGAHVTLVDRLDESLDEVIESATDATGRFDLQGVPSGDVAIDIVAPDGDPATITRRRVLALPGRRNSFDEPIVLVELLPGRSGSVSVSETHGGRLVLPSLAAWSLDVAANTVIFPDGSRSGRLHVVGASLRQFPSPAPDESRVAGAAWILPEGVRFTRPPRLTSPALSMEGGRRPILWSADGADHGGFFASASGVVDAGASIVSTLPESGPTRGGLVFFALPGTPGGERGVFEGSVPSSPLLGEFTPEHPDAPRVGIDVVLASGELVLDEVDLVIRGRGLDFEIRRHYESRQHFAGSLGVGWEHEYADRRLIPTVGGRGARANLLRADGRGRYDEYYFDGATGSWVSPLAIWATLFESGDGGVVERLPDGTRYRYHALDGSGRAGRLESISDRNGNTITFAHDDDGRLLQAIDTLGRKIVYGLDDAGRIETIADFTGRVVRFGHDDADNLETVTCPAVTGAPNGNNFPDGKTERFEYRREATDPRLAHNLVAIYSPRESGAEGVPWLVNEYGEDPGRDDFDRVRTQHWGGTNVSGVPAGGDFVIDFTLHADPEAMRSGDDIGTAASAMAYGPDVERGMTTVTDPRGVVRRYSWNALGLPLRERIITRDDLGPRDPTRRFPAPGTDPAYLDTEYRYTSEGLLLEVVDPGGARTRFDYELDSPFRFARARRLRETRFPAPGSALSAIVKETEREPLFGRPVRESDWFELGTGATSGTRHFFDYQEGTPVELLAADAGVGADDLRVAFEAAGIELEIGDVNGDGVTEGRGGNIVMTIFPRVTLPDGSQQDASELRRWNRFGQPTSLVDAEGQVTEWRYHPENDPEGDGSVNSLPGLDAETGGFLARHVVDVEQPDSTREAPFAALATSYRYDVWGNPQAITDGNGNTTTLAHNALGQLLESRAPSPLDYRRRHYFDADDRLERVEIENLSMTPDGFVFPVTDHQWIVRTLERDLLGRVITDTREISAGEVGPARSAATSFRYDENGRPARAIHPSGAEDRWLHDERGLLLEHVVVASDGSEAARTEYRNDLRGELVAVIGPEDVDLDGEREVVTRVRDGHGRLAASTDANGTTSVYQRDAAGRVVEKAVVASSVDGAGLVARTRWDRDERGRVFALRRSRFGRALEPSEVTETRFLDRLGRVTRRIDALGAETLFVHDGANRLRIETNAVGDRRALDYDAGGYIARITCTEHASDAARTPIERTTQHVFVHDALGRLVASMRPSGETRRWIHDSRDNVIIESDAVGTVIAADSDPVFAPVLHLLTEKQRMSANIHGNRKRIEYDNLDRPVRVIHELRENGQGQSPLVRDNPFNPDGLATIEYDWDDDGRLESWTNDRGHTVTIERDVLGRVRRLEGPGASSAEWTRDRAGNARRIVDRNGSVVTQRFDKRGRTLRREIVRASAATAGVAVEGTTLQVFRWGPGLPGGDADPLFAYDNNDPEDSADDAATIRQRDSLGALILEAQDGFPIDIERDARGDVVAAVAPSGRRVESPRDDVGRPRLLRDGSREYASFVNLGAGASLVPLERRLGNGVAMSVIDDTDDDGPRVFFDEEGRATRARWSDAEGERILEFEYGHDRAGRRTFTRRIHPSISNGDVCQYDSLGRLRRFIPDVRDPRTPPLNPTEFTANLHDGDHNIRFQTIDFINTLVDVSETDALVAFGKTAFGSDAAGQLTSDGERDYRHDAFGRLVRIVERGATIARYGYDADGRLVRRTTDDGGDATTRRFVFRGEDVVEERRADGGLVHEWILDPLMSSTAPIARLTASGELLFYLAEPDGSVAAVTSSTGGLLEETRYRVGGSPRFFNENGARQARSPTGNAHLHRGRRYDDVAGMYVIGSRFFSPALSRFLTPRMVEPEAVMQAAIPEAVIPEATPPGRRASSRAALPEELDVPRNDAGRLLAPPALETNPFVTVPRP